MVLRNIFKRTKVGNMVMNEEKVVEINKLIGEGYSLNKLDKEGKLGCSRKTFCRNVKKLGYKFSKDDNKFILFGDRESAEIIIKDTAPKEDVKKLKNEHKESSDKSDGAITLEQLDIRLKKLEDMVLQSVTSVTQVAQECFIIDERIFTGGVKARTFKVNSGVLEDFDSLCDNELAAYSKTNIISQALREFINKYEK